MRIVLNTRSDCAAATAVIYGLGRRLGEAGVDATVNDWGGYADYDVAVFLGFDHELERARRESSGVRVILADPKLSRPEWIEAARMADALLVSSVEQRDAFLELNRNIHIFHMFPPIEAAPKAHRDKTPVIVGYHGNRVHLEAMGRSVRPALEALARHREIEFWAVYNIAELGKARIGVPDEGAVRVRHIQWTPGYLEELGKADIGIVPNELPIRDRLEALRLAASDERAFMYEPFDHLVRFKVSSNAGRLFPFAQLGIPVVVDFMPSACQFVVDGESGFIASSPHGWFEALDRLSASADLRTRLGRALQARMQAAHDAQVASFLDVCASEAKPAPLVLAGRPSVEAALGELARYRSPKAPLRTRVRRRVRRLLTRA